MTSWIFFLNTKSVDRRNGYVNRDGENKHQSVSSEIARRLMFETAKNERAVERAKNTPNRRKMFIDKSLRT